MNLPNKITLFRVFLIPFFLIFLLVPSIPFGKYIALAIFILASASDALDGYIARSRNLVTNFGKFMDPIADKLLVCSAMICFVKLGSIPAVVVIVIVAREFIVSGLRLVAVDNGVVIAAAKLGKLKTIFQMITCILLIAQLPFSFADVLEQIFIYLSLAFTVISLLEYLWKNRKVLSEKK